MQDLSVYSSNNLAYILHMDSLDLDNMADHNNGPGTAPVESGSDIISGHFLSTEDALLNTQVVRRRTSPRKRLSLNLSNIPPPVINLTSSKPSGGHRRINRLSLPQRLMDLEIDVNSSGVPHHRNPVQPPQPSSWGQACSRSLASPSARCPRTSIPVRAPKTSTKEVPEGKPLSKTTSKITSKVIAEHSSQPIMTESLEQAVAAVKLRPKSPMKAAQRRSNADFRLSFEMSI